MYCCITRLIEALETSRRFEISRLIFIIAMTSTYSRCMLEGLSDVKEFQCTRITLIDISDILSSGCSAMAAAQAPVLYATSSSGSTDRCNSPSWPDASSPSFSPCCPPRRRRTQTRTLYWPGHHAGALFCPCKLIHTRLT